MSSNGQDQVSSAPTEDPQNPSLATAPPTAPDSATTEQPTPSDDRAPRPIPVSDAPEQPPAPSNGVDPHTQPQGISRDEVALYDRQIRLWGMEAQQRIRNANILLINVKALGNEISKNLVLAGVGSLTIFDPNPVTAEDLGAQFLVDEGDIGKPRAEAALPRIQKLNPRVNVSILSTNPFAAPDASFLAPFTVVIVTDMAVLALNLVSGLCRFAGKPFYAGGSHGLYGFIFADLLTHTFTVTREDPQRAAQAGAAETPTRTVVASTSSGKAGGKTTELVTKREEYQPFILVNSAPLPAAIMSRPRRVRQVPWQLPCLRALWAFEQQSGGLPPDTADMTQLAYFTTLSTEKSRELQLPFDHIKAEHLRSFLQNVYLELAPVAAFLGASLAQDVIHVLSQREQPIQNVLLFDGDEGRSEILPLHPLVTTTDSGVV